MSWRDDLGALFTAHGVKLAPGALDSETVKKPRRPREPNPYALAVTKTQAARLLGVDKTTLEALIAEGLVRTVPWRGTSNGAVSAPRRRIPMSEIERLCEEGIPEPGDRPRGGGRRKRSGSPGPDVAARILRIPLD